MTGNVVDVGGDATTVMHIKGVDLLVSANSVRTGKHALQVVGTPMPTSTSVNVIVTSNLTTGIFVSSTGALVRVNNIPPP